MSDLIKLKATYSTLSRILEEFPKNSKHKAAIMANKWMDETLNKIEKLKTCKDE